jgi:integration host factor subunit beta
MTRSELIQQIASHHPELTPKDIETIVSHILDKISSVLEKKGRVEIRGFGIFGILHRPPRNGRNPKTGKTVEVPAKDVPHFKAGKELRERVNHKKTDIR